MPRDLTFQALKLLSQYIVSDHKKIPEGEIFQKTSCMNPEDSELCGWLLALGDFIEDDDPEGAKELRKIETLFEKVGISKWVHGELTHLGFRAGTRYEEVVKLAPDEAVIESLDESDVNAASSSN